MKRPLAFALAVLAMAAYVAGCARPVIGPPGAAPTNVLYVQSNNPQAGQNAIVAYRIAADGTLSEPGAPVDLPVPAQARPQGVVVLWGGCTAEQPPALHPPRVPGETGPGRVGQNAAHLPS